jgi:hypothetical protein
MGSLLLIILACCGGLCWVVLFMSCGLILFIIGLYLCKIIQLCGRNDTLCNTVFKNLWVDRPYYCINHLLSSCYSIFCFMCMFCKSVFVLFLWPLCCPSGLDLRIFITPMISSNFSYSQCRHFIICLATLLNRIY